MKRRDLFFRILTVVAGMEILVMVILGSTGMKEGMGKNLIDAFLLSLLSVPLLYIFVVKSEARSVSEQADLSGRVPEKEMELKAAAEKQELGTRLLSLTNNVPGMVYRGHRDWSLSFIGAEVEPVTGYTAEEFMSGAVNWKEIIHPDDLGWLKETFREAVKDQVKTLRVEYRIKHKNGGIRWVTDRRQMMYDETGSFDYVDGLLLDITERKETERRLVESEYRFRTIADMAVNGMLTADSRGNIDFFNRAAERLFGYASEEVIGKNLTMFIPERYRNAHKAGLERYLKTGESPIIGRTVELEALKKDGTEFSIELSVGRWEAGEEPMFTAIIRDITERKKAEESLHDALQRLAIHDRQMPLGHITLDKECGVVGWNPAAERIFGWSEDEVKGKHPLELFVIPQAQAHVSGVFAKIIEVDDSNYSLDTNLRKDGKTINCEWFITKLRDARGNFSGVCAMAHDVTEKTQMEKQLQTAQRMESVGTLAGGVAHDFNNALTGVLGYGEMLKHRLADNPKALADVDQILRSAERASTLTRQLLTFARRQVIEPVNLSLSKVVLDLSKLLRKVIGEHIEFKTSLHEDLPSVFADPGQMEQVLMNLCLNARDAMPSGGQLLIGTDVTTVDDEYVKLYPYVKEGRYVLLTVSDTGVGMDEKTIERIFEPFFTTKGPEKGTGLGLSVVYGIAKQQNGFIHVYSELGKGTTFEIRLPAVDAKPDARAAAKEEPVRGGNETILLAEDDELVRMLAERTLKECGYRILAACNGEEAVGVFKENAGKINLAVLDVMMPIKGGKEAFEEMHKTHPGLKVIYMSGYSATVVHESFVLHAGVPFLRKPFGPSSLARKVREVLDRQ